jgi:SulP family sulfate permease
MRLSDRKTSGKDITAGLTAAIAGIPDGMASATLAGVNPVYGLYNLMVGTPIAAIFTSSGRSPLPAKVSWCVVVPGHQ